MLAAKMKKLANKDEILVEKLFHLVTALEIK
jgi:hypothetical protein